jgi:DNA-binding LytR/AlgR family response regulator
MIRAIAIDDEPPALKILENFCGKVDFVDLQKTFTKPNEAMRYLKNFPVDLLFLDVQMPSISGIDFYKEIEQNTLLVFTTAFSEYAVEGFNLSAIDYLLKPYTFERFEQAINKVREYYLQQYKGENPTQHHIFIRADYKLIKIAIDDIVYIEGLDDYLKIHLTTRNFVVARMTMKSLMDKLPEKDFIRIHRSFIVPQSKINSVRNKIVQIGPHQLPIGNSYADGFYSQFGQ